jgi:hypothetical protein
MTIPDTGIRWRPSPIFGDRTSIHCLMECIYYLISKLITPQHGRYLFFLLIREHCQHIMCDLSSISYCYLLYSDFMVFYFILFYFLFLIRD